jgi:hypothetical protein
VTESSPEDGGVVKVENVRGFSEKGTRSLAIGYRGLATGSVARAETATFVPSRELARYFDQRGYSLIASPTVYPGQAMRARIVACENNPDPVYVGLHAKCYNASDDLTVLQGDLVRLAPGDSTTMSWRVPDTNGYPIAFAGVQIQGEGEQQGVVYLDYLTWDGTPEVTFNRPPEREANRRAGVDGPTMWKRAWVNGLDSWQALAADDRWAETYRLIQNRGRGLLIQGTREWRDYQVTARMTPHMCQAGGVAVRVQGMRRYYALVVDQERASITRAFEGEDTVLAEAETGWAFGSSYTLKLEVQGSQLAGSIDGRTILRTRDPENAYTGGGIALICEAGRIGCDQVKVGAIAP